MAWKTFNRLTGRSSRPTQCPVSANSIAEQLLANGRLKDPAKDHTRSIKQETTKLWQAPGADGFLSTPFTSEELSNAIGQLKSGKAQGPDNIPPEFLLHCGQRCQNWLKELYSSCLNKLTIPKIWRKGNYHRPAQTQQAHGQPQELPPNLASLRSIQGPGVTSPSPLGSHR